MEQKVTKPEVAASLWEKTLLPLWTIMDKDQSSDLDFAEYVLMLLYSMTLCDFTMICPVFYYSS